MANPWAISGDGGHQKTMSNIMDSKIAFTPPAPKKPSPWSLINPMRAIEKDPILAGVMGKKWTPIDPYFTGQKSQDTSWGFDPGKTTGDMNHAYNPWAK